ncbi:hypothetical protein Syun_027250 [Stephania yunnanensis]|uniref:Uncharacterized protein n=1 Tax=Stephania yunnanensis TaxID=152371 RepID=A0AAP0HMM5_9MAGN
MHVYSPHTVCDAEMSLLNYVLFKCLLYKIGMSVKASLMRCMIEASLAKM